MILEIVVATVAVFISWVAGFITGHARGRVEAYEEGMVNE